MLHETSENRKSRKTLDPRPHERFKFFSKASSSSSSLWSITSLWLDIVRKHLEGIFWKFEKFYEFPEKNNNFLKKLRLLQFRLIFLPNIFLVSAKDPRITKKYWLSQKGQPRSALIFLEMVSLFSGFLVKLSKQWICHILTNKIKYEKLCTLYFHNIWSWRK